MLFCIDADTKRRNQEIELKTNLASWQVWRLAYLMRFKKLPDKPDDLLKAKEAKKGTGENWKAQKSVFEMYNAAFGGFDNRKKDNEQEV